MLGVAYTLRALQKAFYPDQAELAHAELKDHALPPITWQEKTGAVILLGCTLAIGIYPRLLIDWIAPALESPLFDGLRKGVGQ